MYLYINTNQYVYICLNIRLTMEKQICETCKKNPVWSDSSAHYYDKQTPIYYADECLSCLVKSQKERFNTE